MQRAGRRWFASLVGRVWLGMGGLLVLMLVVAGIGLVQSQAVETQQLSAQAEAQRLTASGRRMHDRVTDAYLATLLATMVDAPQDLKFELGSLNKAMAAYRAQFGEVFKQPAEALAQRADELRRAEAELAPLLPSTVKRLQRAEADARAAYQHDSAIQELVVGSLKPLFDQWLRAIDALDTMAVQASETASDAARDIRRLVESSAEEVRAGRALVMKAGDAMQATVAAVQRFTDFLGGIAAAMPGQVAAVDGAVQALEQVTQQNAALVEQGAASAVALGDQARRLKALVALFRLEASS